MSKRRGHASDLRGASRLAIEATRSVMALVETMHRTIAGGPAVLGSPLLLPAGVATGLVYGGLRGVTGLVGRGLDAALSMLGPLLGESAPGPEREAVLAVLNGVLGDYLAETGNPLATPMQLRRGGAVLELSPEDLRAAVPDARGRVVLLLHGSSMNELGWQRDGHDHGAALARDLPCTELYLRYNSGLHVSTNGAALSALIESLVQAWPVQLTDLSLVGHSMGGLVARAACHVAETRSLGWRALLRRLVTLGTPHHGAPLERGGNWVDVLLGLSRYSAPLRKLGQLRSAGVTDLRYGSVRDEDWSGRDRFAHEADPRSELKLPAGVACYALAATRSKLPGPRLLGDGLVPVESALGLHQQAHLDLGFPESHRQIVYGTGHLELLGSAAVYEALRRWLSE